MRITLALVYPLTRKPRQIQGLRAADARPTASSADSTAKQVYA
jgi:hypothetical protein